MKAEQKLFLMIRRISQYARINQLIMNNYSDEQLISLAQENPKKLIKILSSPNADIDLLTCGIEILSGEVKEEELVLPILLLLLKHVNAVVREGAMIGIEAFYFGFCDKCPPETILEKLKLISSNDPSPQLKTFATEILKDINKKYALT